jgi:hypothetical protein
LEKYLDCVPACVNFKVTATGIRFAPEGEYWTVKQPTAPGDIPTRTTRQFCEYLSRNRVSLTHAVFVYTSPPKTQQTPGRFRWPVYREELDSSSEGEDDAQPLLGETVA